MRSILKYINVVASIGTTILMFLVVLSGVNSVGINKDLYWSEASPTDENLRWTNYGICEVSEWSHNENCLPNTVGYPYSPYWSIVGSSSMPADFVVHESLYYYVSRSAYFLLLVGLIFCVFSLFFVILTALVEERKWLYYLFLQVITYGILTTVTGAILMTYIHSRGSKAFDKRGHGMLGLKLFGILWGGVLGYLISTILSYIIVFTRKKEKEHFQKVDHLLQYNNLYQDVNPNDPSYITHSDPESIQKGNQPNPFAENFDTRGVYH
ncbi:protein Sur7p [[Candida] railenensis]|uniref:Protein Sur7p n=1 Tax=[Candida] railenensis TaxID=45579 RepID=A0A9P0QSZ4_9ASCO|nr:protein Sur7p [[Candida] railenensis]